MLGLPLGTVAEIEASVLSGDDLHTKRASGSYLLKVWSVNGRALPEPRVMEFSTPFGRAGLARNAFDLHELKTGEKAESLDSDQIKQLEAGYVGKTVRLVAYEVGAFDGMPHNLPDDVPTWADVGFQFSSSLVALAERK